MAACSVLRADNSQPTHPPDCPCAAAHSPGVNPGRISERRRSGQLFLGHHPHSLEHIRTADMLSGRFPPSRVQRRDSRSPTTTSSQQVSFRCLSRHYLQMATLEHLVSTGGHGLPAEAESRRAMRDLHGRTSNLESLQCSEAPAGTDALGRWFCAHNHPSETPVAARTRAQKEPTAALIATLDLGEFALGQEGRGLDTHPGGRLCVDPSGHFFTVADGCTVHVFRFGGAARTAAAGVRIAALVEGGRIVAVGLQAPAGFGTPGAETTHLEQTPAWMVHGIYEDQEPPRSIALSPCGTLIGKADAWTPSIQLRATHAFLSHRIFRRHRAMLGTSLQGTDVEPMVFVVGALGPSTYASLAVISVAGVNSTSNAASQDFLPRALSPTRQRQLRFISSVAHPSGLVGETTAYDALVDHFQAVPVLGCQELLFVDPTTKLLCLGRHEQASDGRATLRRTVVFSGPDRAYASIFSGVVGPDGGIRVVAGYDSRLFLFCVSADIIATSRRGAQRAEPLRDPDIAAAASGRLGAADARPVVMRGIEFGPVDKLVALALTQGPDVQIWAFSRENKAYIYGVHSDRKSGNVDVQGKLLLRDGTLVDAKDADGDVFMTDTLAGTDETVIPVSSSSTSSSTSTFDADVDPSFSKGHYSSLSEASTVNGDNNGDNGDNDDNNDDDDDDDEDDIFFSPVSANPSRSMGRFGDARYPHTARPCEPTATFVAVAAARY
ncbi:MAG: hypothetical protein M1815_003018 [Lichina confinis]|nr:MAG: hypothetical protein M1815_003018 [Lichina confinis]